MKVSLRSKHRAQKLGLTLLTAFVFSLLTVKSFAGDPEPSSLLSQGKRFLLVENKGQVVDQSGRSRSDVKFIGKAHGVKAIVLSNGISYQFEKHPEIKKKSDPKSISGREEISADGDIETYRLDVRLVGSNPSPTIRREEKTDYFENYYNVPGYPEGIQGVSAFEKVIMENVYPGIDWAIYVRDGKLKYDFIVKPGADPSKIVLEYQGAEKLALQNDGSILATSPMGEVEEAKPVCFSGREEVASAFVLNGNRISFAVNAYDKSQSLVIDPALLWATYYGGSDYDYAYATTTDFFGNVYLAGFVKSAGLATSGAHQTSLSGTLGDAFLAKYDNAGVIQWATYYGGTNLEIGYSVAVTDAGDVYLAGFTNSTAGIASVGAYDVTYGGAGLRDAFLAKFNSSGARQWGTYYGGAGNDEGYSLGLASDGSVYLAGTTGSSADIATLNTYGGGSTDAFMVKFDAAGNRIWGLYYGGAGADEYNGMSIDRVNNNNVYLSGCTNSATGIAMGGSPFQPALGGGMDAFLAKFDAAGSNMWGTYYGGTGDDCGFATAIDKAGAIYMVGRTASNTGISTINARAGAEDGFIAKFASAGTRTWGRYFGGPAKDEGYFVAVDGTNGVYVSGYTESSTGINSSGITGFTAYSGAGDAMAAKFDNAGNPVWSTYYGGSGSDYGYGVTVDGKGDVYLAGQLASSVAMTGGADVTYGGGGGDGFLAKVDESSCPIFTAAPANVTVTSESICSGCMLSGGVITAPTGTPCPYGSTLQYAVSSDGGMTYGTWTSTAPTYDQANAISVKTRCNCDFDNTLSSSESTPVATVPGVCTPPTPSVSAAEGSGNTANDGITCSGDQVTLTASGGVSYSWDDGSATTSIMVSPTATTTTTYTYTVTATAANGCTASATSTVTVNPLPTPAIGYTETSGTTSNDGTICLGSSVSVAVTTAYNSYVWSTTPTQTTQSISESPMSVGTYTYTVTVTDANNCSSATTATVTVVALPTPMIVETDMSGSTPDDGTICTGESATLTASGGTSYSWNTTPPQTTAAITVSPIVNTTYTVTVTNANGCTATSSSTITVKALPTPMISVAETSGSANNDGTICTGASATLTASGGTSYSWSTTPAQTTAAITVSPIADETYTVTVTNSDGCTETASTTIIVKALPTASISVAETSGTINDDGTICTGASATLTASGGTSYSWSTSPAQTTAAIVVSPIANTTYTVTVTNADGCTATATQEIVVKALPTPMIVVAETSGSNNDDGTICTGESATLTASGGGTYSWNTTPPQTTAAVTVSPIVNTTYTVTVTSSDGCTATSSTTITVKALPTPMVTIAETSGTMNNDGTICTGESATLTASGGTSYKWSTTPQQTTAAIVVSPAADETYTVTVTNSDGCTETTSATITVKALPTASITVAESSGTMNNDGTICTGASATLTASGGTSYNWSTTPPQTTAAIVVSPIVNTTYTVTVTNADGCTATSTKEIVVKALPTPSITVTDMSGNTNDDGTICSGASATMTASGGTTYVWSSGESVAAITKSPITTTTYTVTVTNSDGCSSTTATTITVKPLPMPAITVAETSGLMNNDGTICDGASVTLTSSSASSYVWSTTPSQFSQTTTALSPSVTETYTVTVTDANNCQSSTSTIITVKALPTASIAVAETSGTTSDDGIICTGDSATLTASDAGTGGSYSWSSVLGSSASGSVSPIVTTTYTVTVTNADGCTATASKTITVNPLPTPSITVTETSGTANDDGTICNGASVTLTATGGGTYSWSSDLGANASGSVSPTTTTTYTVTVTSADGCTETASTTITVNNLPVASITETDASGSMNDDGEICGGGSATLTAAGGTSYVWSNAAATAANNVSPLVDTEYTVTVTDSNGCTDTDSYTITVAPDDEITLDCVTNTNLLTDNFDTYAAGSTVSSEANWDVWGANPSATVALAAANSAPNGLNMTSMQAAQSVPPVPVTTGIVRASANIRPDANCGGVFAILDDMGQPLMSVKANATSTNQTLSLLDNMFVPVAVVSYVPGEWYNIEFILDLDNDSYNVKVNGVSFAAAVGQTQDYGSVAFANEASGSFDVDDVSVSASVSSGCENQTVCVNSAITTITYTTTNATGATFTGLPAGVTGSWASNTATISGTPTATGTFNYTVTLTGGCTGASATGTINVNSLPPAPSILVAETSGLADDDGTTCTGDMVTLTAVNPAGVTSDFTGSYVFPNWDDSANINGTITFPGGVSGFTSPYAPAPADWTSTPLSGTITHTSTTLTLVSGDTGSPDETTSCISPAADVLLSFAWSYTTADSDAEFDQLWYSVDVDTTRLADGVGNAPRAGTVSVPVQLGQTFCFVQHTDGTAGSGSATTVITMFEAASTTTVALTSANTAMPMGSGGAPEETYYCITPSTDVNLEFDWSYLTTESTTNWDPFFYSVDGVLTQLSVDGTTLSQTGTASVFVPATKQFCFVQSTLDNDNGPATTTITNFSATAGYPMVMWSTGETTSSISVSPTTTTPYTVTVTDVNGCTNTNSVTITVKTPPTVSVDVTEMSGTTPNDGNICNGDAVTMTTNISTGSGNGNYSYEWSTTTDITQSISYSPSTTTTYTVTVTDSNGCTASASTTITVNTPPTASITAEEISGTTNDDGTTCAGDDVLLTASDNTMSGPTGTAPYTYLWSTMATTDAITVSPVSTTSYTVTVTDANGCTSTASRTITVNGLPTPEILVTETSGVKDNDDVVCVGDDVTLMVDSVYAGYVWNTTPNEFTQTIIANPVATTVYEVTVTDGNNCQNTDSATVIVEPLFLNCPDDVTVNNDVDKCGAVVFYPAPVLSGYCGYYFLRQNTNVGPAVGSLLPVGTSIQRWVAFDSHNNPIDSCEFTITVVDMQAPKAVCKNATVTLDPSGNASIASAAVLNGGSTDNCPGTLTYSASQLAFTCADVPSVDVTLTVTDAGGMGVGTCVATVTVRELVRPTVTCPPVSITTNVCNFTVPDMVPTVLAGSTDNCTPNTDLVGTQTPTAGLQYSFVDGASFIIRVSIADESGNITMCSQTVTVDDNTAPVFANCPANITVGNDVDKCGANVFYTIPVATDDCGGVTLTQTTGLAAGALFPLGTTTQTYSAVDAATPSNSATCTFTVTVEDRQAPNAVCKNITVDLSSAGTASVTAADINGGTTDNCTVAPTLAPALTAYTCANLGANNITMTATDAAGNTATCVATVTVRDVTAPAITTCPASATINADANCAGSYTPVAPVATDNCTTTTWTVSQNGASLPVGATTFVYTVTDGSGNTATCAQVITVVDVTKPTIACPANISVGVDVDQCTAVVTYSIPAAFDNCAASSVAQTLGFASGAAFPVGITVNQFTATDASGNTETCAFTVTVSDQQDPVAVCKDITVDLPASGTVSVTVNASDIDGGSSDNCATTLILSPLTTTYTCADLGDNNITLTVSDGTNTSVCVATVTVRDVTAPVVTCPSDVTVFANANCVGSYTPSAPAATDNCAVSAWSVSQNGASLSLGNTTFVYTVSDASGNTSTCAQVVTVVDNTPPTITCPADLTIGTDVDKCTAVVTYSIPAAHDNCALLSVVLTSGQASGTAFALGTTTNTFTATDVNTNTATCAFNVTVVDQQKPVAVCQDITVDLPATGTVSVDVTAAAIDGGSYDNCSSTLARTPAVTTYTCANLGDNNITLVVTDAAGNTDYCVATVTVRDVTAPVVTCPADVTVFANVNCVGSYTPSAPVSTDNCAVSSWSVSQNGASLSLGNTTFVYTVSDASGNTSTCAQVVTVVDNIPPTITCPADLTVGTAVDECTAVVTYSIPAAHDNCALLSVVLTSGQASGSTFALGTTSNTFTATDVNGNTATCSFSVTVVDQQNPTAVCQDITVDLPATGTIAVNVTAVAIDGGSYDNCSSSLTRVPAVTTYTCANLGDNNITLVVTDAAGNTDYCVATVTVRDVTAPVITTCPANLTVGTCEVAIPNLVPSLVSNDNCTVASVVQDPATGVEFGLADGDVQVIKYTVTDGSGNTTTCTSTITIDDVTPPVFTNCPANITVGNDVDKCGANVFYLAPSALDACGDPVVVLVAPSLPAGALFPVGSSTVTYRATDLAGNSTDCVFTVNVTDMQTPTAVCQDVTVNLSASGTVTVTSGQINGGSTDNCTAAGSLVLAPATTAYTCANLGDNNITLTVTDAAGNTSICVATVTVRDVIAPSITTCPANVTVDDCDDVMPNMAASLVATDNCTVASISQNPVAGVDIGQSSGHVQLVTFTVTDNSGNTTTCTATVTILDNVAPAITCPQNIVVPNDVNLCTAVVTYSIPTANDNCTVLNLVRTSGQASGTVFALGTSTVVYRAADVAGNASTCSFTITVEDRQVPIAVCKDVTVTLNAAGAVTVTSAQVNGGSVDNCLGTLTYAPFFQSYTCANVGDNDYVLTVTDPAGNASTCVATVTVRDVTAPVITACAANITVNDCFGTIPSLTAQIVATDACGVANVTQSPTAGSDFTPVSGVSNTIVYTVTDVNGNTSTCSSTVTLIDTTVPSISCPVDITVGTDVDQCTAVVTYSIPVATDNCPTSVSIVRTDGQASGTSFATGVNTVSYRATDVAGNSASCSFSITVRDLQQPQALCVNATIDLDATGSVVVNGFNLQANSYDNCPGPLTYSMPNPTFTCANVGVNYITLFVTDAAGNTGTCVSSVTIRDVTAPTFTCPAPRTVPSCASVIPDVITGLVASDACGVASISQNPPQGVDFGQFNTNSVNVTVSVTDVNGNVGTCIVPVTIQDATPPAFLNCPSTMIMIGNDPDQCSAKASWLVPVAFDDCQYGSVNITQISGPSIGSLIPVLCPPVANVVVYQATDAAGNSSTCSFQVMVVDTEKPEFDADVVMPTNITVECNAVPTNCVFHANGICSPLVNDDVNDNCTAPANLVITYNQVSTQGSNPALCSFYSYTLTRTWTVTDCSGNSRQHTQVITVRDTTRPTAVCKNITVSLNEFGTVTINPRDLDGGSTDNCAANAFLTFTASQTTFTCPNVGDNVVTLTVTDPCGNSSTCTAIVTVLEGPVSCTPVYDFAGSDPCSCLNNATTLHNGQFGEFIQIHAVGGQVWTATAVTGLFLTTSPAPPAAPTPLVAGTVLTGGRLDGVDNDGDGATDENDEAVFYTLRARHVEAIGYTATFRNAAGNQIVLSNKCYYPTPYFTNLDDPFCLGTPAFQIGVGEYNNATGNVVNVMVNGANTTTFNVDALGLGSHTIMATFDAGDAQPYRTVNGVAVDGTEADAINDPGCQQKITEVVQVVSTPNTLVCNDLVHVSIDADCEVTVSPDDVLEGTYFCYDDFLVQVDKVQPYGNGPWVAATFNASDIGKTYQYRIIRIVSGANMCWGSIKIEDKLVPALDCPADITVACSQSTDIPSTGNVGIDDCSSTTTQIEESLVDNGQCGDPRRVITREFIVTDAWGNQSSCVQSITVIAFDLVDVVMPADITVNCENAYNNTGAVAPSSTGRPSINGAIIGSGGLCSASINFTDEIFNVCSGSYTIHRTWRVSNECLPLGNGNPRVYVQRIAVQDMGGPQFVCPDNLTVSVDPLTCCATAALPDVIISEGCSDIISLEAKVTGIDFATSNTVTFVVQGHLADFPGNNYWTADTLAVFPYTQCLPNNSTYTVTYTAEDQCSNLSSCQFQVTVADLIQPVAACDQVTQVALTADGFALVNATTFDDGSYDNCASTLTYKVRRMDQNACDDNSEFDDQVKFCCSDLGDTVTVIFRVYDITLGNGTVAIDTFEGHYNDCMVQALVEDKIKPSCSAPANVTVTCEQFDPSLWLYGYAQGHDNCCLDTVTTTTNYAQFDTVCNKGTITRTFRAFDCAGNSTQCTQRVVVTYTQDYFVRFPDDKIITVCDGTGDYGEPTFYGEDCELLGVTFEDEIFTVVPDACFKIERNWKIINWCTFDPNATGINVPNPNPNAITNHPTNLPGPIVSPIQTAGDPWKSTIVKINPNDAAATNYSVFFAANANFYTYKQIIKIIDTQDPVADCSAAAAAADTICDITANDAALWNEMYWWDLANSTHDLGDAPSDISLTATDACSGANINFEYQLLLDLDGDGTMETVVNSTQLGSQPGGLGWNNILYNNVNVNGGISRQFDNRPVAPNQKWGFAIQEVVSGNKKTASVKFNTQQAQNTFVTPQLPYGNHKIKWFVTDGCGNETICEYPIEIRDCKAPTVVCFNGLSVNIMPTGMITMNDVDFLEYTVDNYTQTQFLQTGIRKCGTGSGFPVDANGNPITTVTFNCSEVGTQCVELWSIDLAGNADYCETYIIVQDNNGNCPNSDKVNVSGALKTEGTDGVEDATVTIDGTVNFAPPFSYFDLSDDLGEYKVTNSVPVASNYTVTPSKDDSPLNGVTTYDLVLISKHILGIEPLGSPYKMIAADANKSNSITTFDIVELRKLILGIYNDLPNNTSWRFIDKSQVFANPLNPFTAPLKENISIADAQSNLVEDFVGVKIGDVNGTAVANSAMQVDDRTNGTLLFDVDNRVVKAGETFDVTFRASEAVQGYQMTLNLNGLEVAGIVKSDKVSENNFGVFDDALTVSVDGENAFTVTFRAAKAGKLSEMMSVSSRITKAEGYNAANNRLDVALRFDGQTIAGVGFELYQNQPNPFINKTFIGFHLPEAATATLTVYDETGRVVFTQQGDYAKGYNAVTLDRALLTTTGVLYYTLTAGDDTATRKMIQARQ